MELKPIEKNEYQQLFGKKLCSKQDVFKLASYPYVSLVSQYQKLSNYEILKIREIEYKNISSFLKVVSLLYGVGSQEELDTMMRNMKNEPLRSAVIASKQEQDPKERFPKYIELACKLLLSVDKNGINCLNAINIKIAGKIPALPFTTQRQKIADIWFSNFVELKLSGMRKVYTDLGDRLAFSFLMSSTIWSLYCFSPKRYDISACSSEDEALHKVFDVFSNLYV